MSGIRSETGRPPAGPGKGPGLCPVTALWLLNNTDMNWMRQCREKGMGGAGGQGVALGFDPIHNDHFLPTCASLGVTGPYVPLVQGTFSSRLAFNHIREWGGDLFFFF